MFTSTDYEKLQQIMEESPEKKELLTRLLSSHQMDLSTIGHEIRNPLTLVYSTLQLIESEHPEVIRFRYWTDMRRDIEYMKHLLEELSSFNNGSRLNMSTIETNTFFKTLALSFATSLIHTNIEFLSYIEPELPSIQGDSIKLREVFLNLLGNAKDAVSLPSDNDRPDPSIHLSVIKKANTFVITIQDNGCGIPKEDLSSVFQPFVTFKKNGTGLGLAIASKVINAHNGTIEVSSVPNVSTTFTLTLPV